MGIKFIMSATCSCIAFVSLSANAVTVVPSDYMIAGNIGDTWDYENLDTTTFTLTLSTVASGPNAGRFKRGNGTLGTVYDVSGNDLSLYELDSNPLIPPLVIGESELGQVFTYNDDPVNPTMYLFWKVPSITIQAGTFNDVLAWVFLDANFSANVANTFLGLDPGITAGVTDINYYAQGIGELGLVGIDAGTGLSDGTGYELVSTSVVPIPAAVWLFGSGFIGLIGLARHKA